MHRRGRSKPERTHPNPLLSSTILLCRSQSYQNLDRWSASNHRCSQLLSNWLQCRPRMERIFCFVTSKQRAQWAADRAERALDHRSHPPPPPPPSGLCRFRRRTFDAGRGLGSVEDQATKSRLQHIVECPLCNPPAESAITSSRPLSLDSFLLLLLSGYLVPWRGREWKERKGRGEWERRRSKIEKKSTRTFELSNQRSDSDFSRFIFLRL